ncbi:MAG: DUF2490 domain-containing protein [Janthinobacterium lividum]
MTRLGHYSQMMWVFFPCVMCLSCRAQSADPSGGAERSAWYMYFGDHPVSEKFSVHLEGQFRRQGMGQRWEQLLVRPGVGYKLPHGMSVLVAYTYLRNYPFEGGSLGDASTNGPQPEHRVLEEFKFTHRLLGSGKQAVQLSHRFRAEQRFQGVSTIGQGTTDWEFAERARYRLTADVPFRWNTAGARPDYSSMYNETFVNFGPHSGTNALDRNRTYGAVGWKVGKYFQVELGYLYQFQPLANGVVNVHSHAFQVTIQSKAPFRHGLRQKD